MPRAVPEIPLRDLAVHARDVYCRVQGIDPIADFEDLSISERSAWEAVARFVAAVVDHDEDGDRAPNLNAYAQPFARGWRPPSLRGIEE